MQEHIPVGLATPPPSEAWLSHGTTFVLTIVMAGFVLLWGATALGRVMAASTIDMMGKLGRKLDDELKIYRDYMDTTVRLIAFYVLATTICLILSTMVLLCFFAGTTN
jgi:hypothetical protein